MIKFQTLARAAFCVLLFAITALTLTPDPEQIDSGMDFTRFLAKILLGDPALGDKVAHFGAYGVLGATLWPANFSLFGSRILAPIALVVYGAFLEFVQGATGARMPELADGFANALGAGTGVFGAILLTGLRAKFLQGAQ